MTRRSKADFSMALYELHYVAVHISAELKEIAEFRAQNKSKYIEDYLKSLVDTHNYNTMLSYVDDFIRKYPRTLWTDKKGQQHADKINLRGKAFRKAQSDYYKYVESIYSVLTKTEAALNIIEWLTDNPELTMRKK